MTRIEVQQLKIRDLLTIKIPCDPYKCCINREYIFIKSTAPQVQESWRKSTIDQNRCLQ